MPGSHRHGHHGHNGIAAVHRKAHSILLKKMGSVNNSHITEAMEHFKSKRNAMHRRLDKVAHHHPHLHDAVMHVVNHVLDKHNKGEGKVTKEDVEAHREEDHDPSHAGAAELDAAALYLTVEFS